jgi:hypothetical protein
VDSDIEEHKDGPLSDFRLSKKISDSEAGQFSVVRGERYSRPLAHTRILPTRVGALLKPLGSALGESFALNRSYAAQCRGLFSLSKETHLAVG